MNANVADMYERWKNLAESINKSGMTYVMEGCFFQSIIRYFIDSAYSTDKIIDYFIRVANILSCTDPMIIFLYRPDIQGNFEAVYGIRGERWKKRILSPNSRYFEHRLYLGDESVYKVWAEYQELSQTVFDRIKVAKIKIDTSQGMWDDYIGKITETAGLTYSSPTKLNLENPEKYCGTFVVEKDGERHTLEIFYDEWKERKALL